MTGSRLDRAGAHRRAQRVRDGVVSINEVLDTLVEIQERQDWLALEYKSWTEYYEGEFGPARLKLTAEQRGQVIAVLVASGMPKRRVAVALGVSEGTVRNDVKRSAGAQNYAPAQENAEVRDPVAAVPAAQRAINDFLANQNTDTPADPPPAPDALEEDSLVAERGQPEQAPEEPANLLGGSDEPPSSGSSDAQPPTESGVSQVRDEPEDGIWVPSSGDPDDAPAPGPVELLEELAKKFEALDVDAVGPMLTTDEIEAIGDALSRIADVVDLITLWQSRTEAIGAQA